MKYTSIQLVGAGRIKSQRFDFDHEDDDAYEWSVDERERELAKAVSLKLKIPAQFLTLEFNSYRDDDEVNNDEVNNDGVWVKYWMTVNNNGSDCDVRALLTPEYVALTENSFKVSEEDHSKMKSDTETADFVLKTKNGTRKFPVHKYILIARSRVFRAMFVSNMAEVSAGEAIIEDLDDDTLEEFIHFLYSGDLSGSRYDIVSLCNAAEKYQLASLMDLVRLNMMSADLDPGQLADLFIASEMFSQEGMFEIAKEKLNAGMWISREVEVKDVKKKRMKLGVKEALEKGMFVKEVLDNIKDRPDLTNKILEL